jgi:YcxB-like protein
VLSAIIVLASCLISRLGFRHCEYHCWIPFALFVLIVYADAWILRRNLSQREARSPAFGPHRMSISADGLVDETPVTRHFYDWTDIERIEADDQFIYVIVDSPLLYMISKRSFANEDKSA